MTGFDRPPGATRVTFSHHRFRELPTMRELTDWEREMSERMLNGEPGVDAAALRQVASALVTSDCLDCPTVELWVDPDAGQLPSLIDAGQPRTGVLSASLHAQVDRVLMVALLHVQEGLLTELEVFRPDGEPLESPPDVDRFETVEVPLPG
jgi:hypothetical protein